MPRLAATLRQLDRILIPLLAVLLPLGVGGCEADLAMPASITVRYQEQAPLTRDRLVVTVDDARSGWYFEGVDFEPAADGWLASRPLRVTAIGGVRIAVALRGTDIAAVATGEIVLPEGTSGHWLVDIFPSELTPTVACGGCAGLAQFAIAEDARPTARDWLYVRWTDSGSSLAGPH